MSYDKIKADGTVIKAIPFTYRVLDSVPVIFQIAEWMLVIVAFQYAEVHSGFFAAKIARIALSVALSIYVGVLTSNLLWRFVDDPYKSRTWDLFARFVLPAISGVAVFGLLQLVKQLVIAHA